MIEMRIFEERPKNWTARITLWLDPEPQPGRVRVLARSFDTNSEAWAWAQRIVNRWKEET